MSNIQAAVSFLSDPSVSSSSLSTKISFLESKGLSKQEIDQAIQIANSTSGHGGQQQLARNGGNGFYQPYGQQMQPDSLRPDWRDWFIMAVVAGGVGTGLFALARKYLLPSLQPPSATELQAAQDALTAKYDEAAAILASLQEETTEIKIIVQEQKEKVDVAVTEVTTALQSMKTTERERTDEVTSMREEVDSLRGLIDKMFDKHREAQATSLTELSQEVKSLKALLAANRRAPLPITSNESQTASGSSGDSPYASSGTSRFGIGGGYSSPNGGSGTLTLSSSFASIANRPPGIPSWQLPQKKEAPPPPRAPSPPKEEDDRTEEAEMQAKELEKRDEEGYTTEEPGSQSEVIV